MDPQELYTILNCIGNGSFGKVYKGIDKRSGQAVAIKIIDVESAEDEVEDIITESSVHSDLQSEYVTRYYGSYLKGSDLWIVMEFCAGGSVADLLGPDHNRPIQEDYISIIMRGALNALSYVHADGKLHRDIKAANILLGQNGQVKLADFGVSAKLTATMTKKNTFVGTPFWMAPEVIKQNGYDHKADIWSLGITAYELANGEPPHAEDHPMKVLFTIANPKTNIPTLKEIEQKRRVKFSASFHEFVELCLRRDPRERPSAKELLKHKFVLKAKGTTNLTELIERKEREEARRVNEPSHDEEQKYSIYGKDEAADEGENDELWDFGTVRPVGGRGTALRPMNDSDTNARAVADVPLSKSRADRDETVKAPSSPQKSPIKSAFPTPAKVPLPPSPTKPVASSSSDAPTMSGRVPASKLANSAATPRTPGGPTAPKVLASQDHKDSPGSDAYDKSFQAQLAQEMGYLKIEDDSSSQRPTPPGKKPQMMIPEIPPFRGPPGRGPALQPKLQTPASGKPVGQQPLPAFSPKDLPSLAQTQTATSMTDQPPLASKTNQASSSTPALSSSSSGQQDPNEELTALNSVLVPALKAAMDRRSYMLRQAGRTSKRETTETQQQRAQAHEKVRRLAEKAAGIFYEIQKCDEETPVGMGGGVTEFLEGFLEEILVRVEAAEEPEPTSRRA
jgi:serine/threonine-protein kinase 24/25/MST4